MQVFQLEIRKFQETLTDISNRYDRLEKKNNILETTIDGVDKTFENLEMLEKRLGECDKQTQTMPDRVRNLESDYSLLTAQSGKINEVFDKMTSLDSILKDTDLRIEEVAKNKDWIAKTEKRLEEMTKEAQGQVKLYSDLLKGERRKKNNEGAPPLAVRENVIKLARQGWTSEEISTSLKLTLGEVELILDFFADNSLDR